MNRQDTATAIYLKLARVAASVLGSADIVENVCVRRSVASGEVVFGRSDIDLSVLIRDAGGSLLHLLNLFRALRCSIPILGECLIYDHPDTETWFETDTFRASIDRRASILLRGSAHPIPDLPVQPEQAARRCAFWLDPYLATAWRGRNVRNLRKLAVEMWNAAATAEGRIAEPFVRRQDALACWRRDAAFPLHETSDARRLLATCFRIAAGLHRSMLPPLEPLREPVVLRTALPPSFNARTLVVIPEPDGELPSAASRSDSLLFTPEALHLYVEYVNAYASWALPAELETLGIHPSFAAFERSCRFYGASFRTRGPGFDRTLPSTAVARMLVSRHAADSLARGERPQAPPAKVVSAARAVSSSVSRYYREVYPGLAAECTALWSGLGCRRPRTS